MGFRKGSLLDRALRATSPTYRGEPLLRKELPMYTYQAKIERVVDGDTYDAAINVGFGLVYHVRLRLRDMDTPETYGSGTAAEKEHGRAATEFVRKAMEGATVTVRTHKLGIYGRWGADVQLPDGQDLATVLRRKGFEKRASYE